MADMTLDEYIDWLLSSNQDPILQRVARNILDEPIPEATKKRLLKPLLPRPIPPLRMRKLQKQKAVLQQFDPLHASTKHRSGVKNRRELLPLVVASQNFTEPPPFVLLKQAGALKDYPAMVPIGHRFEDDALAFLNVIRQAQQRR